MRTPKPGGGVPLLTLLLLLAPLSGCRQATAARPDPGPAPLLPNVTDIVLTGKPVQTNLRRLGINLSGQSFYDSGQMLRNLTFRNPGFEGGTWQSILHCKTVTANTCTDENQYAVWPANFMQGAHYQVINRTAREPSSARPRPGTARASS